MNNEEFSKQFVVNSTKTAGFLILKGKSQYVYLFSAMEYRAFFTELISKNRREERGLHKADASFRRKQAKRSNCNLTGERTVRHDSGFGFLRWPPGTDE